MTKFYIILLISFTISTYKLHSDLPYAAIVDAKHSGKAGELVTGIPTYKSIEEALSAVPNPNTEPYIIYIRNGFYHEKLTINKAHIQFWGENRASTILSFDASGDTKSPDGDRYGTRGSSTLSIATPGFYAADLTIENRFDYPGNAAKSDDDPTKIRSPQAVAVMTTAGSDKSIFHNCKIRGFQDTLFPDAGRHYFYKCHISGHVDFIFGAGQAVFKECDIVSRDRKNKNPTGYISAPSTLISKPYGFLFIDSRLLKETPDLPANSVRLGRPWHPNANPKVSGSAVFIRCYMDDHIDDKGYAPISARDSMGQRIWYEVKADSRFFEYDSYGPGAIKSPARPTLDAESADWYSVKNVLNGWVPVIE